MMNQPTNLGAITERRIVSTQTVRPSRIYKNGIRKPQVAKRWDEVARVYRWDVVFPPCNNFGRWIVEPEAKLVAKAQQWCFWANYKIAKAIGEAKCLTREDCMELALHQNIRERAKAGLEGRDPSSPGELGHVPPNHLLMAQLELSGKETDAARAERDALAAELKALRERSGAAEIDREKVRDAIAETLGDMIFDVILDELTDAAVSAIAR